MIGFRVDANEVIATGHLMRCIAIAQGFQKQGEEVMFFLAEEKETNRLKAQNMPYIILHSRWDALEQEVLDLKRLLKQYQITKLIVDSYQAAASYLEELNQCVKVIYIDDMEKALYPVSAVLHYSSWPEDKAYERRYNGTGTICMAGMQYTPLRTEFYPNQGNNAQKNILITTGGTDQYNIAGRLLEYFIKADKRQSDIHFLVISGSMNQNKPFLENLAKDHPNIILYENVNCMGKLMRSAYLAVSAGGTTLYELCACRVPTVCFSFADNQEGFTCEMGKRGIMRYAGDARKSEDIVERIYNNMMELWEDTHLYVQYQKKMGRLVDGKGVERIVENVLALEGTRQI